MSVRYTLKVLNHHGAPVAGAEVEVTVDRINLLREKTGDDGRASFAFPSPINLITVKVNGKQQRSIVRVFTNTDDTVRV